MIISRSLFSLYYPEFRILIISLASIIFVGIILLIYIKRTENNGNEIKDLKKSLKRAEDLIEIRADVKNLKDIS